MRGRPQLCIGLALLWFVNITGCAVTEERDYPYPKASDDASIVYALQSNKERTHFYVDDKEMGVGRRLYIKVANRGHTVVAKPEGCVSKEEFVQPPFSAEAPLSFTFLTGECDEQAAQPSSAATSAPNLAESKLGSIEPPISAKKQSSGIPEQGYNITGTRTALVIGNSNYGNLGQLKNPVNDARDIASALRVLGFSVVLKINADQEEMESAIVGLGNRLKGGGVGLFYYAGHGVQLDGRNYLIPIGAEINSQKDVRYKAIDLGQVLDEMDDARNGLNIIILDACRDNPLPRSVRSGAARGLATVDAARDAAKGTFIAFATSPGSVALDGEDRNGVFTKHLLQNIQAPGLSLEQVFKRILQGVDGETRGKQTPWSSTSFIGDFYFSQQASPTEPSASQR